MTFPTIPMSLLGSTTAAVSGISSVAALSRAISHPTLDAGIFFALFAGGFFWAFAAGRRKVVSGIMITYIALAVFPALPTDRIISAFGAHLRSFGALAVFITLFAFLILLLGARRGRAFSLGGPWWQTLVLSFLQMGLLAHTALYLLSADKRELLSPLTRRIFADPGVHLWWLLAPVVFLIIVRRLSMRED